MCTLMTGAKANKANQLTLKNLTQSACDLCDFVKSVLFKVRKHQGLNYCVSHLIVIEWHSGKAHEVSLIFNGMVVC